MLRFVSSVIGIVVLVVAVCFAVANRAWVAWGLWPLAGQLELPLFVPVLGLGFVGFLAGGLVAWASGARWRRLARRRGRDVDALERRVSMLEAKPPAPTPPPAPGHALATVTTGAAPAARA